MGKVIWDGSGNLAEKIGSQTTFITGANIRKKKPKAKILSKELANEGSSTLAPGWTITSVPKRKDDEVDCG